MSYNLSLCFYKFTDFVKPYVISWVLWELWSLPPRLALLREAVGLISESD